MTKRYHTRLCVGGALDGQRHETAEGRRSFCVPALSAEPVTITVPMRSLARGTHGLDMPVAVLEERYIESEVLTPQGAIIFWVPDGSSPFEMLDLLTRGYNPKAAT